MKKSHLLLVGSGLILASCAEDITPQPAPSRDADGNVAMSFNFRTGNMTRDGEETDLEEIYEEFGVWAYKSDAANKFAASMAADGNTVMENYLVGHNGTKWNANTAGVGSGSYVEWFYENLGSEQYTDSPSNNPYQYLKYWDMGKTYTGFFAYAPYKQGGNTPDFAFDATNNLATLTFNEPISMSSQGDEVLFAAQIEENVDHAGTATVPLHFNRLTSKIQMAIYEDIPGYHVEMMNVDYKCGSNATVNLPIVSFPAKVNGENYDRGDILFKGKPVVTFDLAPANTGKGAFTSVSTATTNIASVSYLEAEAHGHEPYTYLEFALPGTNLIAMDPAETDDTKKIYISDSRNTPSASETVYTVIPNDGTNRPAGIEANDGIQIVMNFRLVADDTDEVIVVKNARTYVPASAVAWAANTIYTYIFKITKDVKGTTTGDDPTLEPENPGQALYPIIFEDVQVRKMDEVTSDNGGEGWPVSN